MSSKATDLHLLFIIAQFPDREPVRRWYASPQYAEVLKVRAASGHGLRMRQTAV
ncbi:DUF1330 domain-containing protein [Rhizobium sp.]|uniref:DUF1330 domain-containing protein n=1 Tax=Rhizobium sp. TaxID=391 RepID=UPI0039172272